MKKLLASLMLVFGCAIGNLMAQTNTNITLVTYPVMSNYVRNAFNTQFFATNTYPYPITNLNGVPIQGAVFNGITNIGYFTNIGDIYITGNITIGSNVNILGLVTNYNGTYNNGASELEYLLAFDSVVPGATNAGYTNNIYTNTGQARILEFKGVATLSSGGTGNFGFNISWTNIAGVSNFANILANQAGNSLTSRIFAPFLIDVTPNGVITLYESNSTGASVRINYRLYSTL